MEADYADRGRGRPDGSADSATVRWGRIWACRTVLLAVASHQGANGHDSEDVVQDAMLRAARHPEISGAQLQGWLVVVTMRLCIDGHRNRFSEIQRWRRASRQAVIEQPEQHPEDQVCDRGEAVWAASLAAELLPPRQVRALHLSAAGCDVRQVADSLGVTYRTAESLLARARRTMRTALTTAGADTWHRPAGSSAGTVAAIAPPRTLRTSQAMAQLTSP
jgi:RNA polymerase sigma factor (sigma-70 family)